jgi:alanyl-tRNA synthetase
MQQYKAEFKDESFTGIIANVQPCIRLNDLDEIGDKTHLLSFNMLGLFSFRTLTVEQAIRFWIGFLDMLGVKPDYVTVHPDKRNDTTWTNVYDELGYNIVESDDCTWSDGEIGGYCTEFFVVMQNGTHLEIGNIVNPLGNCIDVGFGAERLDMIVNGTVNKTREEALIDTCEQIKKCGYKPSATKQGYVYRKLLKALRELNSNYDCKYYAEEINRYKRVLERYNKLKDKHADKSKEWWYDTHGIDTSEFT